jgi:hypothetical protein
VKLIVFATGLMSLLAGGALSPAATVGSAAAESVAIQDQPLAATRSLAGEQWHYRAQVDGSGGLDEITITAQPGFTLTYGVGVGQILLPSTSTAAPRSRRPGRTSATTRSAPPGPRGSEPRTSIAAGARRSSWGSPPEHTPKGSSPTPTAPTASC